MKSKLKQIVLATAMLLSLNSVFAQHLAVDSLNNMPDSVHCYVPYQMIRVTIKNLDTISFTGNVSICIRDSFVQHTDTLINNVFVDTIAGGGTRNLLCSLYYFTPASYAAGHDVVIVWPIANLNVHGDSLVSWIYMNCTAGIPVIPAKSAFSIFPNPAKDYLLFESIYLPRDVEYVRIIDLIKGEINRQIPSDNSIIIGNLPAGMYFIELKLRNGTAIKKKFIKE